MNDGSVELDVRQNAVAASVELRSQNSLLLPQKMALEMVVSGAPLQHILKFLTGIVEEQADRCVVASILLLDAAGCLRTGAGPSLPDAYNAAIDGLKARADLGTCSVAAVTGQVVITPDIDADPKWAPIKHLPLGLGLKAAWSQPIVDGSGRVLGTFGTYFRECRAPSELERHLVGVLSQTAALAIERKRADDEREQQKRALDTALEAAGMGTWKYTFSDSICLCSPRAMELYGLPDPNWLHDEDGVLTVLHPDDVSRMWQHVRQACDPAGTGRYSVEYRVRRADGGWRWLSVWGVVEFTEGPERRAIAMVGASRDITDQKEADQQQKLLINELNHRVKNTLTIIQSIAKQTLRNTPDPAAFQNNFSARISALARAHSLLTSNLWTFVPFAEIAATTLSPYTSGDDGRVRLKGPPVTVPANAAVTLSLMLHELATNAAKHGALSVLQGHVSLHWQRCPKDNSVLRVTWQEHNGPRVGKPTHKGLGTKLVAASAEQLGSEVVTDFRPEGLLCRFSCAIPDVATRQAERGLAQES